MAVVIQNVQLSPAQTTLAGSFLFIGLLYFAFQLKNLVFVLLSNFVIPGKKVRSDSLLSTNLQAELGLAIIIWSPRILGSCHRCERRNRQAICVAAGKGGLQHRPCLADCLEIGGSVS